MSEAKHSPLPWIWDEPDNWLGLSARICTEKYEPIAQVQLSGWPRRVGLANAAFLVRAANAHERLVAACEAVLACPVCEDECRRPFLAVSRAVADQIRAALAKT